MKQKLFRTLSIIALCGVLGGLCAGCVCAIGGGDGKEKGAVAPTKGQELIDLKKARDQGAISEEEYQNQKSQLMHR